MTKKIARRLDLLDTDENDPKHIKLSTVNSGNIPPLQKTGQLLKTASNKKLVFAVNTHNKDENINNINKNNSNSSSNGQGTDARVVGTCTEKMKRQDSGLSSVPVLNKKLSFAMSTKDDDNSIMNNNNDRLIADNYSSSFKCSNSGYRSGSGILSRLPSFSDSICFADFLTRKDSQSLSLADLLPTLNSYDDREAMLSPERTTGNKTNGCTLGEEEIAGGEGGIGGGARRGNDGCDGVGGTRGNGKGRGQRMMMMMMSSPTPVKKKRVTRLLDENPSLGDGFGKEDGTTQPALVKSQSAHDKEIRSAALHMKIAQLPSLWNPYSEDHYCPESNQAIMDKNKKAMALLSSSVNQPNRYNIEFEEIEVVGSGDFSLVCKARHRIDGRIYALKKSTTQLSNFKTRMSALQEVFVLSVAGCHASIVQYCNSWFEDKGQRLFIQMEHCAGGNLESYNWHNATVSKRDYLIDCLHQISSALEYLHSRGIAHTDVKPANIFIAEDGTFRLGDFGLACRTSGEDYSGIEGDARYLCPTVLEGNKTKLATADVFSLGVSMVELSSGQQMQNGSQLWKMVRSHNQQDRDEVSQMLLDFYGDEIGHLVFECIHPDPEKRPTANQLHRRVALHLGGIKSSHIKAQDDATQSATMEIARLRTELEAEREKVRNLQLLLQSR